MTEPQLVATAWTSAGDTSPMRTPATSPVPLTQRVIGRLHSWESSANTTTV